MYWLILLNCFNVDINIKVHCRQTVIVPLNSYVYTFINQLLCNHLMWLHSPIQPYRMVVQHLNKPASKAIRRWLSFFWELGPTQIFRTRWEQDLCMQTWLIESDAIHHSCEAIQTYSNFRVYYPDLLSYYTTNVHIHQFYFSKEWWFVEPENRSDFTQCKFPHYSSV